jgi:molybdopterin molybdotransferase
MGTEFLKTTDLKEVENIIKKIPFKRKKERIPLKEAHRRVLAEDIITNIDLPPFNRVLMDGYAVKAEDTFSASEEDPSILKIIENINAGQVASKIVEKGTCIEVSTGAPMPEGADAVVMVEFTEINDGNVYILQSVHNGQDFTEKGKDIKKGELLLREGSLLTHDKIGALAAIGAGEVKVYKKPEIAIISTGNEIIEYDEKMEYGKIYDINSQTIANAVKSCGCKPLFRGIAKDNYKNLKNSIKQNLDADVIITSGGTSAGTGDVLKSVLDDIGEVFVHGITVKPGKPTIIGMIDKKPIFGLPGNPAAALIVFHVLVAPYLRSMASRSMISRSNILKLQIASRYYSSRGRHQYVLVKIEGNQAYPILKDSGAITAFVEADGYFEIPKNVEMMMEGSEIEVILLESQ